MSATCAYTSFRFFLAHNDSYACVVRYVNTMLRYLVDEAKDKRQHIMSGVEIAQWVKLHDLAKVQTKEKL